MMEELMTTVRERYRRHVSFRGLITLEYRANPAPVQSADTEEIPPRGFMGLLHSQLQGVSKRLRDEISKLFERRDKHILQTMMRDMPRIIGKNTAQLRSDSQRSEKLQTEKAMRLQKRVELFTADTGAKFKIVQRELERLRAVEKARARDESKKAYEQPIVERNAQRNAKREAEREREELRREIGAQIVKTERRITRKLRDEEEYEKRRRS